MPRRNIPRPRSRCSACVVLNRGCNPQCIFTPYFHCENSITRSVTIRDVFTIRNVVSLLTPLSASDRFWASDTFLFEVQARLQDPVYGCVSHILTLQQQVKAYSTLEQIKNFSHVPKALTHNSIRAISFSSRFSLAASTVRYLWRPSSPAAVCITGVPRPSPLIFVAPFALSYPASQRHITSGVHISVFFAAASRRGHSVPAPASQQFRTERFLLCFLLDFCCGYC
ncbi:LOB domain-containing protein CRL1-like [Diospyros lotus]|uniref:LOB domain-containing protein CRL1-like n=1 Tax=Diospyros lotus TaxID=55363 RepID=UPI00225153D2|nr:LOB domain-containing protein CRL1-like [Diospyros lotus]